MISRELHNIFKNHKVAHLVNEYIIVINDDWYTPNEFVSEMGLEDAFGPGMVFEHIVQAVKESISWLRKQGVKPIDADSASEGDEGYNLTLMIDFVKSVERLEESFGDNNAAIVIKEEYITDFVDKCSETWNGLKKDGYDVGIKEPNWLAIPAVPGIFNEYFYCKFIISPDTKTVKYSVKVDKHKEIVLNESMEDFDSKYHRSYQFAKDKHDATGAVRKFSGAPYIVHPDGVAKIVDAYGGDDDQIKIAVLHDTIEDTDTNFDEIEDLFGEEVATGVEMLSNDKSEIDKMGKETYMSKKLLSLPEKYLFVKLADFLYNILDHPKESQLERMINNLIALSRNRHLSKKCSEILDACLEAAAFQI